MTGSPTNNGKRISSKPSIIWCFGTFIVGFMAGRQNPMVELTREGRKQMEMAATQKVKKRPLQIFPLLRDLRCGWNNMQTPQLLEKAANGKRSLIVDIGLDQGAEFFGAIRNGFEVVGMEPNPETFPNLRKRCESMSKCHVVDLKKAALPLQRFPGHSYLINAGAGSTEGVVSFASQGPVSTIVDKKMNEKQTMVDVPIVRVDNIIDEDIYLFKIDTQGFDQHVLQGASKIFENHVVRQVIAEVDPLNLSRHNHNPATILEFLQDAGMVCLQTRRDQLEQCKYYGESIDGFMDVFNIKQTGPNFPWNECWEDFICINIEKEFTGNHPPNKKENK